MKGQKLYDKITEIDLDFIIEASEYKPKNNVLELRRNRIIAAAACVVLFFGTASGFFIYAEAREYNAAITFFNEHSLSEEGLTRGEIKNVYRDITTRKFSYGKTVDVLEKSVGGHEIFQDEPTPEDVEGLWNYLNNKKDIPKRLPSDNGISYIYDIIDKSTSGNFLWDTVIKQYKNGEPTWSITIENVFLHDYVEGDGFIVAYGGEILYKSGIKNNQGRVILIDNMGKIIWDREVLNNLRSEHILKIVLNNGKIAAFGSGISDDDTHYRCFTEFDMEGNIINFTKKEYSGINTLRKAVKFGSGYLLQFRDETGDSLVKVTSDGVFEDSVAYSNGDDNLFITDMIEFNGVIYLSADSVPKPKETEYPIYGRDDIGSILDLILNNEKYRDYSLPDAEMTKLMRDNFTAVLLLCDNETGMPKTFYSVKGSFGSKLSIKDDYLIWNVESILHSFYSPMTSSFTIGGECNIYKYTFDETGKIISREKTEEVISFRK